MKKLKDGGIHGYIGHLEVIAYPNCEIPYYKVLHTGFTTNIHTIVKKGSYIGTVKFLEYNRD